MIAHRAHRSYAPSAIVFFAPYKIANVIGLLYAKGKDTVTILTSTFPVSINERCSCFMDSKSGPRKYSQESKELSQAVEGLAYVRQCSFRHSVLQLSKGCPRTVRPLRSTNAIKREFQIPTSYDVRAAQRH